jgi:hypothetical protein
MLISASLNGLFMLIHPRNPSQDVDFFIQLFYIQNRLIYKKFAGIFFKVLTSLATFADIYAGKGIVF